jgi:hypothetical protein
MRDKPMLVAVFRRCKHEHVLYPTLLIERFGENTHAVDIRSFLHRRHRHWRASCTRDGSCRRRWPADSSMALPALARGDLVAVADIERAAQGFLRKRMKL